MNMKRTIYAVTIMMIITLMMITVSGCGEKSASEPVSLAVIGVKHGNFPVYSSDCKAVYNSFYNVAYTHGDVVMIDSGGSPQVYFQATIPEENVSGLSENKQKQIAVNYTVQLQAAYAEVAPTAPEVNTLKAVSIAARALEDSAGTKELLIVDSGLQTTGYINFVNGLLDAQSEDIVEALEQMQALPDLTGVRCMWVGLGETIAPQKALSERQRENLKEIWQSVLYAAGAEAVDFNGGYSTNTVYENAPDVTTVAVETESINVEKREAKESPTIEITGSEKPIETIILDSTKLQFLGDQAVFADESKAQKTLEETARQLLAHPNNHVYVIGTTAGSADNEFTRQLSEARADTVKRKLAQMGVLEDQMTAIGLGSSDPYHEYDLDENGNMIEEIAKKNRKTIIMDVNSVEARLLQ